MRIFHVVDESGKRVDAEQGFWAIDESGRLVEVVDGWGCEGGGGSSYPPAGYRMVLGSYSEPQTGAAQTEPEWLCQCGKKFKTDDSLTQHQIAKGHCRVTSQEQA